MSFFRRFSIFVAFAALALSGFGCKYAPKPYSQQEITKVSRTEYKNYNNFYTLNYPSNWRIAEYSDALEIVGFIAPNNPATPGYDPVAEVSVIIRDNPTRADINKFYTDKKR